MTILVKYSKYVGGIQAIILGIFYIHSPWSRTFLRASVNLKVFLPVARKSVKRQVVFVGIVVEGDVVEIYEQIPVFSLYFFLSTPVAGLPCSLA